MPSTPPIDHSVLLSLVDKIGVTFGEAIYISKELNRYYVNNDRISSQFLSDFGTGFTIYGKNNKQFYGTNRYNSIWRDLDRLSTRLCRTDSGDETYSIDHLANDVQSSIDISDENTPFVDFSDDPQNFCVYLKDYLNNYKGIKFNIELDNYTISKQYSSTTGSVIEQKYTLNYLTVKIRYKSSPHTHFVSLGGVTSAALDEHYVTSQVNRAVNELLLKMGARQIKSTISPVVLSDDMTWTLLHETVGHGIEGDGIINGDSFLTGFRGYTISTEELNIIDESNAKNAGWTAFDDQGQKSGGTSIVEDGIVSSYITDKESSLSLNQISTGNARTWNYYNPPIVRQTNFLIEPGNYREEELLSEVGDGFYIGSPLSASVSIYTGEYFIKPQFAYRVSNGEFQEPVIINGIHGYALKTLREITALGRITSSYPTICYKKAASVPVGMVSPSSLVSRMEVVG